MTNFGGDIAYQGGKDAASRGLMGNAPRILQFPSDRLPDAAIALYDHDLPK